MSHKNVDSKNRLRSVVVGFRMSPEEARCNYKWKSKSIYWIKKRTHCIIQRVPKTKRLFSNFR